MRTRILVLSQAFLTSTTIMAGAQSMRDAAVPAELPPASFGGAQYVDSEGCVFLRAGVNGNTVWVPRVTRSRKQVCEHSPTFSSATVDGSSHIRLPAPAAEILNEPRPVAVTVASVSPTRAVPVVAAPVPEMPQPVTVNAARIPAGFRSAWDDGRLNPNRAVGTATGDAQMEMIWTNTVPRRLVPKP